MKWIELFQALWFELVFFGVALTLWFSLFAWLPYVFKHF